MRDFKFNKPVAIRNRLRKPKLRNRDNSIPHVNLKRIYLSSREVYVSWEENQANGYSFLFDSYTW